LLDSEWKDDIGQIMGMRVFWVGVILATVAAVIAPFALPDIAAAGQ
jgi:predicted KAP-like P-loop ATPase